jgi:hypothetical protein
VTLEIQVKPDLKVQQVILGIKEILVILDLMDSWEQKDPPVNMVMSGIAALLVWEV